LLIELLLNDKLIMQLYLMSLIQLFYLADMTHIQIAFFFLKILNLGISLSDLTLKGNNLIFEVLVELFLFLLLFFDENVMVITLSLELILFLGKCSGKMFFILNKPFLCLA
jgi:hypothetical protein